MTLPYIPSEYMNTWRFIHPDGLFEASFTKSGCIFTLSFRRAVNDNSFTDQWDYLMVEHGDTERRYFKEIVDIGINKFLEKYNIDISLPDNIKERLKYDKKTVVRTVNKKKYSIEGHVSYKMGGPEAHPSHNYRCQCGILVYHPAAFVVNIYPYKMQGGSMKKHYKPISSESFDCENFDKGLTYLQNLIDDPKSFVMESIL